MPRARQEIDHKRREEQAREVLEKLARLAVPESQDTDTVDEFAHQQLLIGARELGIGVTRTNEIKGSNRRVRAVYMYPGDWTTREINFSLLTHLGAEALGVEISSRVSFSVEKFDLSRVYKWERKVVGELATKHPHSIFVKGLRQALPPDSIEVSHWDDFMDQLYLRIHQSPKE